MMASGESRHSSIGLAAILIVLALLGSCEASGIYRGVVVDAETNDRLPGVVVVVLWQKKPIICMDCPLYFHNVKEDVTDVNGGSYIDESRGINFNPLTRVVDAPSVIAFKPGYVPLVPWNTSLHGYPSDEGLAESLQHGALIRLTKAHSREEEKRFDSLVDLDIDMDTPHSRIPELMKAINTERKRLGLDPYRD